MLLFEGNPIVQRLTRHPRLPSLRVALWTAFIGGLAIGAGLLWEALYPGNTGTFFGACIAVMGMLVAFLAPLVTSVVAGTLTARDVQQDDFKLLRLTGISANAIIWGYVAASLHRVRWLLAALIALWPGIVIGWIPYSIWSYSILYDTMGSYMDNSYKMIVLQYMQKTIIADALSVGGLAVWGWFVCGVAAVVGVSQGLARRTSVAAMTVALPVVLLNMVSALATRYHYEPLYKLIEILLTGAITGATLWASLNSARRALEAKRR